MVDMAICLSCTNASSPISNAEFVFTSFKPSRVKFAPFTGDRVRGVVNCFRCCKPRCIYAQKQLSTRERYLLEEVTANNVFSCGSPLLPPIHPLGERISMRLFHSCEDPVEVAFYCSYLDSSNVCCYCGSSDKKLREELALPRRQHLMPVCEQCKLTGRQARSFLPEKRSNRNEGEEDSHFWKYDYFNSLLWRCWVRTDTFFYRDTKADTHTNRMIIAEIFFNCITLFEK